MKLVIHAIGVLQMIIIINMRIYDYIFYKLHHFFSSISDEMPVFLGVMALCWLFLINSFTIFGFLFLRYDHLASHYTKIGSILFGVFIISTHFIYFFRKNRHFKIIERHNKEKGILRLLGSLGVILYSFLTFWIFFKYIVPNVGEGINWFKLFLGQWEWKSKKQKLSIPTQII